VNNKICFCLQRVLGGISALVRRRLLLLLAAAGVVVAAAGVMRIEITENKISIPLFEDRESELRAMDNKVTGED
jgi:hypothetical protein